MKFKIKNKTDLPADYFSSLVGWTNNPKATPAPNKIINVSTPAPLVNEKTGKTFREESKEYSAEFADIDRLLSQMFQGGGTWK